MWEKDPSLCHNMHGLVKEFHDAAALREKCSGSIILTHIYKRKKIMALSSSFPLKHCFIKIVGLDSMACVLCDWTIFPNGQVDLFVWEICNNILSAKRHGESFLSSSSKFFLKLKIIQLLKPSYTFIAMSMQPLTHTVYACSFYQMLVCQGMCKIMLSTHTWLSFVERVWTLGYCDKTAF